MTRLVLREIRRNFGRWLAILAIIALGSGFLSGLMQTAPAMLHTMREYIKNSVMYDWWVVMPDGFDSSEIDAAGDVRGVRAAEAAIEADALVDSSIGEDEVIRLHSITEKVNLLALRAGRMPEKADECIADSKAYTAADIGTRIIISDKNPAETLDKFTYKEYTIVGVASSPVYINYERGSSTLGSGTVRAFIFLTREGFADDRCNDLFIALDTEVEIYTDSYDRILRITQRRLLDYAEENFSSSEMEDAYVLSRKNNVGFASFESDAGIVEGVARVFPLFFFLIAAFICVTTMTRMVDEQRTQIGVLRALGFGTARIAGTYIIYAASASVLGCVIGFWAGSALIPDIIWRAYNIIYHQGALNYHPNLLLGAGLTVFFTAAACLATYLVFLREDSEAPAQLLRPRVPKAGRRSVLENLPFFGKKLSPSGKVTLRNLLRGYVRVITTILAVAGCMALLLTAYGIRDSVSGVVSAQFDDVTLYDYLVAFSAEPDAEKLAEFRKGPGAGLDRYQLLYQGNMDIDDGETVKSAIVVASPENTLEGLVDFHTGSEKLAFPGVGEALVCAKIADIYGVGVGDDLTLRSSDGNWLELKITGVFDNYFYNYVAISTETFEDQWGYTPELKTIFATANTESDVHEAAAELLGFDGVLTVAVSEDTANRVDKMMLALNYIVWLVIVCSGALAFIVVYDLTDINLIERSREIATVKVLGFYPGETAGYVFRENAILTVVGAIVGIPFGNMLHAFVVNQINVDLIHFELRILPASYLTAIILTFVFVAAVDILMHFRLDRINMAEALKSNE